MGEDNKSNISRLFSEALDHGDLDSLDRFYADDAEVHIPGVPEDPFGSEPIRELFATVRRAFPGVRSVIEDLIAEGDKVVARVSFRATSGEGQAVPPQTRLAMWQRVDVFRLFDGRVVEHWADRTPPGFPAGHPQIMLADVLEHRGEPQEAARLREQARRINPEAWTPAPAPRR